MPEIPRSPDDPSSGFNESPRSSSVGFDGLSIAVMILLGIMAALSIFLSIAFYLSSQAIDESLAYDESGFVEDAAVRELSDSDRLVATSMRLFALGVLVTAPVFITWQHRHARTAERLSPQVGVGRASWAIAGWFVPIANLVLPGMQLYHSSKASDPRVHPGQPALHGRGNGTVTTWAVILGLSAAASVLAGGAEPQPYQASESEVVEGFVRAEQYRSFGALGLAAAASVGVFMVRDLARAQATKLRLAEASHG